MNIDHLILSWLQRDVDKTAEKITHVNVYSSDWEGDTDVVFYHNFFLGVKYQTKNGNIVHYKADGKKLQDLWEYVIHDET